VTPTCPLCCPLIAPLPERYDHAVPNLQTASPILRDLIAGGTQLIPGERFDSPLGQWLEARRSWLATGGYRLRMRTNPPGYLPGLLVWTERVPPIRRDGMRECPCCGSLVGRRTARRRRSRGLSQGAGLPRCQKSDTSDTPLSGRVRTADSDGIRAQVGRPVGRG
jgi:hypothetical protein